MQEAAGAADAVSTAMAGNNGAEAGKIEADQGAADVASATSAAADNSKARVHNLVMFLFLFHVPLRFRRGSPDGPKIRETH